MALKKDREAAEHLAYAIRVFPATGEVTRRQMLEAALSDLKKKLGTVNVLVNVDGAKVMAGGVAVGTAPLADPVFVDPGTTRIEAVLAGHTTASMDVEVAAGNERFIELKLEPNGSSVTPPGGDGLPSWPGWLLGGVGVAALGAGIPLLVVGTSRKSEVEEISAGILEAGGLCDPPRGPGSGDCAAAQEALDDHNTFSPAGVGLIVSGGALLAGGIIWIAVAASGGDATESAAMPKVVPWASSEGGGVVVGWVIE